MFYDAQMETSGEQPRRRGYGQYCAVASALDVVGERWTLLIVRDLFLGPKRYTDLRAGLPGIATDLLTARLRTLEGAGLVHRRTLPKPAPATVYELTDRGRLLGPALGALAQVGFAFLDEPGDDTHMPPERLVLALRAAFVATAVPDHRATYQLELDDEAFYLAVDGDDIAVAPGSAPHPTLTLGTRPVTLTRLLRGTTDPDDAIASGDLRLQGSRSSLDDFLAAFALRAAKRGESGATVPARIVEGRADHGKDRDERER
jgi:DNA-binding HxlR family transcriptional regulator/putative sterol carrier protein